MTSATRWTVLVVASSIAAVLAAIAATGDARSMIPLLWFLAVIPGLPYVRMLRNTTDAVALWVTALGLSISIDAVVAEALLYTHTYTATTAVVVLACIACLGAVIGRLRLPGGASEPAEAASSRV
jgi:hypothetical protein